jgi:hypothetical protein
MKKNDVFFGLFLLTCAGFLVGAFLFVSAGNVPKEGDRKNQIVGGDSDEHGCKASAGYSWCESSGKCVRMWEDGYACGGAEGYYVGYNRTKCAATTWICNEGMQQFYDETGCGCEQKTPIPVEPIGGDKDKEGCLIGSGYFWNESIGACVRSWELNENEAKAAQIAVSPISTRPVTVVEVITARCPGCFEVKIQTGEGDPYIVSINNWKISNEKSCPDTCPLLSQPGPSFCSDGTIVDQGKDECGCQLPPKCEKENIEN